MEPQLTIVIPVYNRAALVERCLNSVLAQTVRPLRVVVVDNASTDGTSALLHRWRAEHESSAMSVLIVTEQSPGAAAARAAGLRRVTTPYVYFFDSDDLLRPDTAASFLEAFNRNPDACIVAAPTLYHSSSGSTRTYRLRPGNMLIQHFMHCTLRTQAYAVRTDYLRAVGGWHAQLRIWDDWELGLRLLLPEPPVVKLRHVVADIYGQPDSVTGDLYSHRHEHYGAVLRAVARDIAESRHPDSLRLTRLLISRRMMLAALYAREGRDDLSRPMYDFAMQEAVGDPWLCRLLRFAFRYRRAGLRGIDSLLAPLM